MFGALIGRTNIHHTKRFTFKTDGARFQSGYGGSIHGGDVRIEWSCQSDQGQGQDPFDIPIDPADIDPPNFDNPNIELAFGPIDPATILDLERSLNNFFESIFGVFLKNFSKIFQKFFKYFSKIFKGAFYYGLFGKA